MNTYDPICPCCGAQNCDFEDTEDETWDNDYYIRTYTCSCPSCGSLFDFREYYKLYRVEHSRREDDEWYDNNEVK